MIELVGGFRARVSWAELVDQWLANDPLALFYIHHIIRMNRAHTHTQTRARACDINVHTVIIRKFSAEV